MRVILLAAMMATTSVATAAQNSSAVYIQRTMKMLEESTAENPAQVRVLFYGQSITAQAWTRIVQKQLAERYPTAKFEFRNAAIGGYISNVLIRTADHDLYPWYPDLLFFHVYGPMDKYEEIVRRVRERTSAEIVIWTSHLNSLSRDKPNEINTTHDARAAEIRAVASKYSCMLIDLREKWRKHLKDNGLGVTDLLSDTVHLNPQGCELYAGLISEELVRAPELGDNPTASGTITTVPAVAPEVTRRGDGRLTLRFTGNRVVAVSGGTGAASAKAAVLLDGKAMDGRKELWAITRPSVGPARIWMPAVNNIAFEAPLVEEDWTLTCLPDSTRDGKKIRFRVQGSVTGEDGEGWNTERFVSRSRRTIIEPSDWRIAWTLGYRKATLPEGFQVTWRSYPMFARVYEPKPTGTRTLLVQGCANRAHTLTFISQGGALGISEFVVHAPATNAASTDSVDWDRLAEEDAKQDFTTIIFDGRAPNQLSCDTTVRPMPDGSWVTVMLGGGHTEPLPANRVFLSRSRDRGKSWTPMSPIDLGIKSKDPTRAITLSELMLNGQRTTMVLQIHNGGFGEWKTCFVHSDDSCRTWSTLEPAPGKLADRTMIRNAIKTRDGRILMPYQHYNRCDETGHRISKGRVLYTPRDPRTGVIESHDGGRTWELYGEIRLTADDHYHGWAEPNIVELSDGRIAMIIRADRLGGVLYSAESKDGGHTWPKMADKSTVPNPGSKATLYGLGGDTVALLHNPNPRHRSPLALWISFDGLKTWPYRRVLVPESCDKGGRLNYPDGFVSEDGRFLNFAFDDNRHRCVFYRAKLPALASP